MGSLTSRPKAKAQSQVVYMPAPTYTPPPTTQAPPLSTDTDNNSQTPDQARAASLLLRDRGAFGTVLTGFRGLLSPMENFGSRKTLLGE